MPAPALNWNRWLPSSPAGRARLLEALSEVCRGRWSSMTNRQSSSQTRSQCSPGPPPSPALLPPLPACSSCCQTRAPTAATAAVLLQPRLYTACMIGPQLFAHSSGVHGSLVAETDAETQAKLRKLATAAAEAAEAAAHRTVI